eukprot:TCALIF_13168-PA protein Name:"Similar to klhl21 Kelch-like protein 21 (Xenopus laevis)" AED:0.13 eAED:0.13 QI:24/0.66/0.5/1/0.33/0.25/4/0/246
MEDTNIKCILCSTMCLAQLKLEERFHPESHGVLVHSNETQCAQIRMKTDHVFCFEADFVDEETMTLVDTDLNKPIYIGNEPYVTLYLEQTLKFAPMNHTPNPLPEFVAPKTPIPFDHYNLLTIFNRKDEWDSLPPSTEGHETGGIGILGNQLIIIGGITVDGKKTDICERFDPPTNSWVIAPSLPQAMSHLTLVQVSSNTIILVGGFSTTFVKETYLLSKGDAQWTQLEDRPEPVYHSTCGVVVLG